MHGDGQSAFHQGGGRFLRPSVAARLATLSSTGRSVRLFMVPGMTHRAGGPGATSFDMQPELERWVERGEAPERVIAVKPGSEASFSRPLCAWPKTAHYSGNGSTANAENFVCFIFLLIYTLVKDL